MSDAPPAHSRCGAGTEFTDTVSLGNGLTINGQSIGVATESEGFDGVDGIVGYVPSSLP